MTTLQNKRASRARRDGAHASARLPADFSRDIEARYRKQPDHSVASLRKLRREVSRELRGVSGTQVLTLAETLLGTGECSRWFAHELVHFHPEAAAKLSAAWLERLGKGNREWHHVDPFATYLLGPAWREGAITDGEIARWARSHDRWRRRSALVATVALNNTARGGRGDTKRTLAVCDRLRLDRDDMVVKAMSWALRELARKDPKAVAQYLARHESELAALVLREVRNKLRTGLKNPGKKPDASRR